MNTAQTYTLTNPTTQQLSFKLYPFDDIGQMESVHRLNYYTLVWIQEGTGTAMVEEEEYTYKPNTIFTTSPYEPFGFIPQTCTKGIMINFHPDFFCLYHHHQEIACDGVLFSNAYAYPYIEINPKDAKDLHWIINEMQQDITDEQTATHDAITSYLKLILIRCVRIKKKQHTITNFIHVQQTDSQIMHQLRELIEQNYCRLHSTKDYAELLNISPNALTKLTRKTLQKTPTKIIVDRIIIEAKRELFLTKKTVDQIAANLGYEDPFYFSRFFKKHVSVSPTHYRKTVGKSN